MDPALKTDLILRTSYFKRYAIRIVMMPLQLGEYRRHERALFSDYWIVIAWVWVAFANLGKRFLIAIDINVFDRLKIWISNRI